MKTGKYLDVNYIKEKTGKSSYQLAKEYGVKEWSFHKYKRKGMPDNIRALMEMLINEGLADSNLITNKKPKASYGRG
jgi:hypothetical protein